MDLRVELELSRLENERLRAELRGRPRRIPKKIADKRRALDDAETLLLWWAAGIGVRRRTSREYGMSERRYRRAYNLLRKWGRI